MNKGKEARSAAFGLNWLQEGKNTGANVTGSYDDEQDIWVTSDRQVFASNTIAYTYLDSSLTTLGNCDALDD